MPATAALVPSGLMAAASIPLVTGALKVLINLAFL
jgi:hypothetical protein